MKKNNHLFRILMVLSVIVAVWSCQTDLVSPQTENRAISQNQSQSLSANRNSRETAALEQGEEEDALVSNIVARRDRPDSWNTMGNAEYIEYYSQIFDENPEIDAIFHNEVCSNEFGGIVLPTGTSEEEGIIFASDNLPNNAQLIDLRAIRQPNTTPGAGIRLGACEWWNKFYHYVANR